MDQPSAAAAGSDGEPATSDEFEHQPTRIHANTIPTPEIVDDEFDHSETTSKKPRPEGLDEHLDDAADAKDGADGEDESESEAT